MDPLDRDPSDAATASARPACTGAAGKVAPYIDRNRCEGKAACVQVCPYGVFEIGTLGRDERATLSLRGRLKALAHRHRQAFVVRADECHACGLCVDACPEAAIRLAPNTRR